MSVRCPSCGATLAIEGENGLCGSCLISLALSSAEPEPDSDPSDIGPLLARRIEPLGVKLYEFGDYQLVEELARGGMGVVFRARQVSLNRTVALKLIAAGHLASAEQVRRFRTEAETAAGLDHPNIVPIYEVGERGGQHFFAMKLVEGGSLAQRLSGSRAGDTPPLPIEAAARLLASIARTVHFAHQRGILHRDLKPGNILLDREGQPHITDFGLAKVLTEGADLTQTMAVLGTPHYMSPEQARGQVTGLTVASDVYSLGAVLYELLAGEPPFTGGSIVEVLRRVAEEEPKPPSQVKGNPNGNGMERILDRDLETICLKCLDKDPQRRYGSAASVAGDLERWLAHEPIEARPATRRERVAKWTRRNPTLALATALLLVVGITGFVGVFTQLQRAQKGEREAQRQLYAANVNRAQQAWEEGNLVRARALLETARGAEEGLLGFEWRYLYQLCHDESTYTFASHEPAVAVPSLPDDQISTSRASDGGFRAAIFVAKDRLVLGERHNVRLASLTGEEELLFREPEGIRMMTLSPSHSNLLAVVTLNHDIKLWDLSTRQPIATNTGHTGIVRAVSISPDGKWLASLGDSTVRLWNFAPGENPGRTSGVHKWPAENLAFSADSRHLITCGRDGPIRIRDVATGLEDGAPLEGHTAYVLVLTVSPDGRHLASASNDGRIILWDLASRRSIHEFVDQRAGILCLAFSHDGQRLASGGRDQTIRFWHLRPEPHQEAILRGHEGAVKSVAFSPDGKRLVSVGRKEVEAPRVANQPRRYLRNWSAKVWDAAPQNQRGVLGDHGAYVARVQFSPDGKWLASADYRGLAKLWDIRSQRLMSNLRGHTDQLHIDFAPDSKLLATADMGGIVRLWRPGSENPVAILTNDFTVAAIKISPDGQTLAVGGWTRSGARLQLWNLPALQPTKAWAGDGYSLWSLAYDHPRGRYLAGGFTDGTVLLWDATTLRLLNTCKEHYRGVPWLAFSPDGNQLATGSEEGTITLCDARPPNKVIAVLRGHTHWVWSLAFTPDGRSLASSGVDGTPKIWSLAAGEVALTLKSARGPVVSLAFAPDGNLLVTGGADGLIQLWEAAPMELTDAARKPPASGP